MGIETIKCNDCAFDESAIYDIFPEQKSNQKAKGNYTPYKAGGSGRTVKRQTNK